MVEAIKEHALAKEETDSGNQLSMIAQKILQLNPLNLLPIQSKWFALTYC